MPYYMLFDTETTGNQENDRIIQVGAIVVKSKDSFEVYDEYCSAAVPISIEAMEVHNITPDIIADKPTYDKTGFSKRIEELNDEENYLVAHNIGFDLGMIEKEGFQNKYKLIDTVRCAKHLFPDMPYHRLQYLRYSLDLYKGEQEEAERMGVEIKAHDAIGDVLILKLLFSRLIKETKEQFPDDNPVDKMVELTQTPVLMRQFKFGKYKGEEIEHVANKDIGYLKWMRKNLDLDEDLTYTLDHYL